MKTHFYFLALFILLIMLCNGQQQTTPSGFPESRMAQTTTLTLEDQLHLEVFPVESGPAVLQIKEASKTFSLGPKPLKFSIESISAIALANIQVTATTLSSACTNSVTALKIFYGCINNELVVFYKPILCCRTSTSLGTNYEVEGDYTVTEFPDYFVYRNFRFEQLTNDDDKKNAQDAINNYTLSLRIKESTGTRTFNPVYDITGDVRSVYFSFQEMFTVMSENATNSLFLWNTLKIIPYSGRNYLKHSILLSADNIITVPFKKKEMFVFEKKYANLAHLCPPSCGAAKFRLRS